MKTIQQFKKDVTDKVTWNAQIGFWFGYMYKLYEAGKIEYKDAIAELIKLDGYTGV